MNDAREILAIINNRGYESYLVGGCVRDRLLGRPCNDIDIATNMPMAEIESVFVTHDIGKNRDLGVSVIKFNDKIYEIANFRKDGVYSDGRHPDSVEVVDSFRTDCLRRDFTVNGMGMDLNGNVIDYVGGQADLELGLIKCIGLPEQRFQEDYLRMLRSIRFASNLNFNIARLTYEAICKYSYKIDFISKERVQKELWKMASQTGESFSEAIMLLKDTGLLYYILPEIDCMDKYEHHPEYHPEGNVYEHTLAALRKYRGSNPLVNFSILFHDVGKPATRLYEEDGKVTYHRHAHYGVEIAEGICSRLKFSNDVRDTIIFCVENHMKFHKFLDMKSSKITKLITNKDWIILLEVGQVDDKCRGFDTSDFWNKVYDRVINLRSKYIESDYYSHIRKNVDGGLIMAVTGLCPGPEIGRIQKQVINWVIDFDISLDDELAIESRIKLVESIL